MNSDSKAKDDFLWGDAATASGPTEPVTSTPSVLVEPSNAESSVHSSAGMEFLESRWKELSSENIVAEQKSISVPQESEPLVEVSVPEWQLAGEPAMPDEKESGKIQIAIPEPQKSDVNEKLKDADLQIFKLNGQLTSLQNDLLEWKKQIKEEQKINDQLRRENRIFREQTGPKNSDEKSRDDVKRIQLKEKEIEAKYDLLRRDMQVLLESKDKHILELQQKCDATGLDFESLEDKLRERTLIVQEVASKKRRLKETLKIALALADDLDNLADGHEPSSK